MKKNIIVVICIIFAFLVGCSETNKIESGEEDIEQSQVFEQMSVSSEVDKQMNQTTDYSINVTQIDASLFPVIEGYISVTDKDDNAIERLGSNNFQIVENGAEQKIKEVKSILTSKETVSLCIIFDTSGSMESTNLASSKKSALDFINELDKTGPYRAEIISFDDTVEIKESFTDDSAKVKSGIEKLIANGKTSLYDGLIVGINETKNQVGTKCIIAFSDGKDDGSSNATKDDVINEAKMSGIPVYTIALGDKAYVEDLKEIAENTNGQFYTAGTGEELKNIYNQIVKKQQTQYCVTYETDNPDMNGVWREVEVNCVDNSNSQLALSGYYSPVKENINASITQLDNSQFPLVKLYMSIYDENNNPIKGLTNDLFVLKEKDSQNIDPSIQQIESISQLTTDEPISFGLVMDTSGSMNNENKLSKSKEAAINFFNVLNYGAKDKVDVIGFGDTSQLYCDFGSDKSKLIDSINSMFAQGGTALYDALYESLMRTNMKSGLKCIIVFTDGINNSSTHTHNEIIDIAKKTGIPIYTIGMGSDVDEISLRDIAQKTGGLYITSPTASDLEKIYKSIFKIQKEQYVLTYKSASTDKNSMWRDIIIDLSNSKYKGTMRKSYVPTSNIDSSSLEKQNKKLIPILQATSSSHLKPEKKYSYEAPKAIDNNMDTVWSEGVSGDGIGEWLKLDLGKEVDVSKMVLYNGHFSTHELYAKNNAISKVKLEFSDGTTMTVDSLKNDFKPQNIEFGRTIKTSSIKIYIEGVYKGNKYEDTCITEVKVYE